MNGRGAHIDPASPLAREPFLAVAELAGTAAQGRILLAAPIALAEIEARFADRIEAREDIIFDAASVSLRGRNSRRLGAIVLSDRPFPVEPDDETARIFADGIASARHRAAAMDDSADPMARPHHVPAPKRRRRMAGSVRSRACRNPRANGLRRRWQRKPRSARSRRMSWSGACTICCRGRSSAGSMPRRQRISKRRPARACRSITRRKAARKSRSASRSCSASTAIRRSAAAKSRF